MRGVVVAPLVAAVLLLSTGCAATNRQALTSPEVSPSIPALLTSPTPSQSPPAGSPTPAVSPTASKLVISSLPFHIGEVGVAYTPVALGAKGGVPPYRWSINSGTFPGGLTVSSAGTAAGTPTIAGAYTFVVRVDDAAGGAAGVTRSITVARHLAVSGSCSALCSVEQGCTTVCGSFGSLVGGVAPFTYARTAGTLPPSTSLSGLSLAGSFTTVARYTFGVTVTDALGTTGAVSASFNVFTHITFTTTSVTCSQSSAQCLTSLTYVGGTPNAKPTVKVGPFLDSNGKPGPPPPNGYLVSASGGVVDFRANGQGYTATVTLVLVDGSQCGPGARCASNTATVTILL
jgi:hypothetical protein